MPLTVTPGELAAALQPPGLGSFNIVINPGPGLSGNAAALAAFGRAADQWEAWISDPITVTVDADLQNLGNPSVIGSASSVILQASYTSIRNQIVASADGDDGILASLPTAAQFSVFLPAGFSLTGNLDSTKAALKAMGFAGLDGTFGVTDATITFNTQFIFDFDNSNGVSGGTVDFETVAAHEIGHALGFISDVDVTDTAAPQPVNVGALDLFRFADGTANDPGTAGQFTTFVRSMVPNSNDVFDDIAFEGRMSTGVNNGDGRQASHWKDDSLTGTLIGVMDPTLPNATVEVVVQPDVRALDRIGYDVVLGSTTTTTSTTSTTSTTLPPPQCGPTPAVGCHSGLPLKSSVLLKRTPGDDTKDQIKWKLSKGDATGIGEFMDPVGGTATHHFCIYDASAAPQPLLEAVVLPGGTCSGRPCWKAAGTTGFKYKNKLAMPDGVTDEKLKSGAVDKSQVSVKAKGALIDMPALPLTTPVTVQLVITDGVTTSCWQTAFPTSLKNDTFQFRAKGP
jgi:hypothetical protein